MAQEIELKLALPESAQRAFLRHPLLKTAEEKHAAQLVSVYYDTPDLALQKSGVAVRLRRQGRAWLQTVKCAGSAAGGLSVRPEWETPYGEHFDFSAIDDDAVRTRLEKPRVRSRLAPVFETSFRRTTWSFGDVLLVLDRGWIAAGGRREPISELELELTGGDVRRLFQLALKLAEQLPLLPAPLSKADRGFRLRRSLSTPPAKAGPIPLDGSAPPLAAFQAVALSCLDQMQRNHAGAVASEDPEYIHQLRVGTRRLRAALRLFAPLLPAGRDEEVLPPLRGMMGLLGRARDFDVLLAEIVDPVITALPDEPRLAALAAIITDRRHTVRHQAVTHLTSREFGRLMLQLASQCCEKGPTNPANPETTASFATARLRRLRRKVHELADAARPDDPVSLHALRIGVKRLRYALEFFAPLSRDKAQRRLVDKLAEAQGTLGQLNDLANAGRLLMECAGHDERLREAVTLIGGWHAPRHAGLMAGVPKLLESLRNMPKLG
jgi:inorganic triphosphatase YgiF